MLSYLASSGTLFFTSAPFHRLDFSLSITVSRLTFWSRIVGVRVLGFERGGFTDEHTGEKRNDGMEREGEWDEEIKKKKYGGRNFFFPPGVYGSRIYGSGELRFFILFEGQMKNRFPAPLKMKFSYLLHIFLFSILICFGFCYPNFSARVLPALASANALAFRLASARDDKHPAWPLPLCTIYVMSIPARPSLSI